MSVDPAVRERIQQAYSQYLKGRDLKARWGQKQMIGAIANYVAGIETNGEGQRQSDPGVCVIEAGTGTGKTLAYLTALLPYIESLQKKLVISTATITLQQQILEVELPAFRTHSGVTFQAALAKGRGRFLCLHKLDLHLQEENVEDLFGPGTDAEEATQAFPKEDYEALLHKLSAEAWDGDLDSLSEPVDEGLWRTLTVDNRQCLNRSCAFIQQCPFYRNRAQQEEAQVIVANHDLVLADLALGGGIVLPDPAETLYLFDEAHHLAEKTLQHFSAQAGLRGIRTTLNQLSRVCVEMQSLSGHDAGIVSLAQDMTPHIQQLHLSLNALQERIASELEWKTDSDQNEWRVRFSQGQIPEWLHLDASAILPLAQRILDHQESLLERARELNDDRSTGLQNDGRWSRYLVSLASLSRPLEGQARLWQILLRDDSEALPVARWVSSFDPDAADMARLNASPTDASRYLLEYLWNRAFGVVLASATLSLAGDFAYFRQRLGLPERSVCHSYPSPFDYQGQGRLVRLDLGMDPSDRQEYYDRLTEVLKANIDRKRATLVLFTGKRHLKAVADRLEQDSQFDELCLRQSGNNRAQILQAHRERVEAGEGSCLLGLASFAEGLDLPGELLEHVIITRLPFSVPDDPIEATLSEWLESQGRSPFFEISLPAASIRLIQACGRLLRSEKDSGQITVLDRRLWTKRYGARMLQALPPFALGAVERF